jgi:ElaB/YqjD/DUF883 family membrane-anchored ribosome-binding protein
MAAEPDPEVIREQIDETRSALTEKLELLEAEVKDTVETAKETVQGTIDTVKETVQDTVDTVKRTFDLPYQVEQRPWLMMGLSLAAGVAAGVLIGGRRPASDRMVSGMSLSYMSPGPPPAYGHNGPASRPAEPARPGFFDKLAGQLGVEFEKAKDLAIDAMVGVVSEVARKSIPAVAGGVEQMMTNAASNIVGQPTEPREPYRHPAAY